MIILIIPDHLVGGPVAFFHVGGKVRNYPLSVPPKTYLFLGHLRKPKPIGDRPNWQHTAGFIGFEGKIWQLGKQLLSVTR